MNDRAGLFRPGWIAQVECTGRRAELQGGRGGEGMEADDLLCSRNARPEKALVGRAQWKINQFPSLADDEQAWREHFYRLTRTIEDRPAHPWRRVGEERGAEKKGKAR